MNAKTEFTSHTKDLPRVIAAAIAVNYRQSNGVNLFLGESYSQSEYEAFLNLLDRIDYYNGFGGQELFGYIWYEDGTWSERYEYDGSESWDYKKRPVIEPFVLEEY